MDALSVVSQLRDLASEPQNREVIVQDQGCLPGLVLFLDHQNPDVLFATLQVCERGWTGVLTCLMIPLLPAIFQVLSLYYLNITFLNVISYC